MKPAGKLHDLFSMPSPSQTDNSQHDDNAVMNHSTPEKRSSLQHRPPRSSKEKVSNSRGRKPLKPGKTSEQTGPDEHEAIAENITLENFRKPPLDKKATAVDEVVKYMSSVPNYLQHLEKDDNNVQVKAFNFGVLDWGRLEKWTYLQKQGANRRGSDSPSSSNSSPSSSFSTFASTSHSTRSNASPVLQSKQDAHRSTTLESRQTKLMDGQNSVQVMMTPDSKTSHNRPSTKYSPEKGDSSFLDAKVSSTDTPQPRDTFSSSYTSSADDSLAFPYNEVKCQIGKSRGAEKLKNCELQNSFQNLDLPENWLQDEYSVVEGMFDHIQESNRARRTSYDSAAVNIRRPVEVTRNSFSGNLFSSEGQFTSRPSDILYSCPLPSASQSDEPSISRTSKELLPSTVKSKHMMVGRFSDLSTEKSVNSMSDNSDQGEGNVGTAPPPYLSSIGLTRIKCSSLSDGSSGQPVKQTTVSNKYHEDTPTTRIRANRGISPHCMLIAGFNRIRNSYLGEGSSGQEVKQTICSDKSSKESAASTNSKSRCSPLRRTIDPLMKSMNPISFSGPLTSFPRHQARESSNGRISSGNEQCKSSESITNSSVQAESHGNSTKQALLKLAWKNELPVFVFSSSQNTVLAATMGKRSVQPKNDFECMYTIFTAEELKKKGGIWGSQGNKNKKNNLAYNVVGQMRVSYKKSTHFNSKNLFLMREFVLVGTELSPTSHSCVTPLSNSELAAIVIGVQNRRPKVPDLQSLLSRDQSQTNPAENRCTTESLQDEQKYDSSRTPSVVAILPSGVHGTSSSGQPSSLIDRWRSGGACDCGGWDEGCMLSILTNKTPDGKSSSSSQSFTADGTHIVELFNQGEASENRCAFKMTAFREGVYAVDFGASVSLLQSFAMCIAFLHGRKPTTLSGLLSSTEIKRFQEQTFSSQKNPDAVPASYVPHHPPLSPVRRS